MSTILRMPGTYQNKNRIVTKTQELMRGSHKSQQRELVAQQTLILQQQLRTLHAKQAERAKKPNEAQATPQTPQYERPVEFLFDTTKTSDSKFAAPSDDLSQSTFAKQTIFVSVASYRDRECLPTVRDLFAKAEYPDRVMVGVYEQNDSETDKAITISHLIQNEPKQVSDLLAFYEKDQLRLMFSPCEDAKGPMYARAQIEQNLFQKEDFYMIIDSHTLMEPKWDSICLQQLEKAKKFCARPVLSYYPPNFDMQKRLRTPLQLNPNLKLEYLRLDKFDKNCGFPLPTKQAYVQLPREPIRSLFWTASFSFASSSMIEHVPFDDGYPYLFLGEEICMNLRLYTHGYDVFGPTQHILYHIQDREYRPTFWELFYANQKPRDASFIVSDQDRETRKAQQMASVKRISQLIFNHSKHDIPDRYGLGFIRTYEQFCNFIGINFERQQAKEHTHLGRTKEFLPEEQYAKTVKNATPPTTTNTPTTLNGLKPRLIQAKTPTFARMQMNNHNLRNTPTSKMTGLTGGAMFDASNSKNKTKTIPRTRTFGNMPATRTQQPRAGPPQPRAYAQGVWGKS